MCRRRNYVNITQKYLTMVKVFNTKMERGGTAYESPSSEVVRLGQERCFVATGGGTLPTIDNNELFDEDFDN